MVDIIARHFEFIINPPADPSSEVIKEQAELLSDSYPNDLTNDDLEEELRHFVKFFKLWGHRQKEIKH